MKDALIKFNAALTGYRTSILLWLSYFAAIIPWVGDTLTSVTGAGGDAGLMIGAIISSIKSLMTLLATLKAKAVA